jgi:beta-galactosidase/beta-glucuronidase
MLARADKMLRREAALKKLIVVAVGFFFAATFVLHAQVRQTEQYTRGVGVYPGDPSEYDGATLVAGGQTYRNLALHRPAYSSSSYDYNLTAQLVTDGIRNTRLPRWIISSTSEIGVMPRNTREHLVDHNPVSDVDLPSTGGWAQVEMAGGEEIPEVDQIDVAIRPQTMDAEPQTWTCIVLGSADGQTWTELGRATKTDVLAAKSPWLPFSVSISVKLDAPSLRRFYRVQFQAPNVFKWGVGDLAFFDKGSRVEVGGPYDFVSAWKSAGDGRQWVYVDLGAESEFDHVILYWIRPAAEGAVQVSDDTETWQTIAPLPTNGAVIDDLKLAQPAHGRYVRVLMTKAATTDGYILSEMEVYGRGGVVPQAQPARAAEADGRLELSRGNWRLQRDSLVSLNGEAISQSGFNDSDWLPATVPGTVLSSYWDDGVVPDPNCGTNQLMISDSFFYADFWYRDTFIAPRAGPGKHLWLNFDGVNWKADVFVNGTKLGAIEGGFMRGQFEITSLVRPGTTNVLAVRVHKNANPGSTKEKTLAEPDWNGGALGADNPTYHASIGWDWIPTIRGRDSGIWGSVYLTTTGAVTIEHPFVSTTLPLPDISTADVSVEVTLRNHDDQPMNGTLRGQFGTVKFEKRVEIAAGAETTVKFDPSATPALHLKNPKLWWPNGYGDPNLYDVKLSFESASGRVSDRSEFQTGVRQFTYSEAGDALRIWINGRRFIPRGGNWGFAESMLRYRAREFDAAVRYHRDMNFNMIRDWVGQIGDDAFYRACDEYGIVVWQDFWLANPWDGPEPDDDAMFLRNATDLVERIRNHPSIGNFCGRNEGFPPKPLEDGLTDLLAKLDPGIHYFPNSAFGVVSGGGPYWAMPRKFYFEERATPKLHSELGRPSIVTLDSLKQMMPEADQWPISEDWGLHDFSQHGAAHAAEFREMIDKSFGPSNSLAEWDELAQFENYDGYRAMYEAQSKNRMGMLIWMSHPAWPSFVWQTYDYYLDPSAAYFGAKKASEPLHIQWNPLTDNVEVVNYSGGNLTALTAEAEIRNMDGSVQWQKSATLDSKEDSVETPIKLEYPATLSPVHFIRLRLMRGGEVVSDNFYWRGTEEGNYQALRQLPKVDLQATTQSKRQGSAWLLTTELTNTSRSPALMVRVKAVREKTGDRILPAIYSDNYVALMPGEHRTIQTELQDADTRGERPRIAVEGFNLGQVNEK